MADIPGRILLADSNSLMLNLQRGYFSRQRINVACAKTGPEALKMFEALRPQVAVLAYELSELDGASCCAKIKAQQLQPSTPVLLLAPNDEDVIRRCWDAGCDGVLVRPVHRRELTHVTQKFINLSMRQTPRVESRLAVQYGFGNDLDLHGHTLNLSSGGIYLESPEACSSGQEISLELVLPEHSRPLKLKGRVAWINQGEERSRKDLAEGFGIAFTSLTNMDVRSLQQYVVKTLRSTHS